MSVVPVSLGHHYAVSAGHGLAALAAFEVLEGGGNAVDGGVAAILTLGVVYSDQVSIAGVAPMIVDLADGGETWTIAGVGGWPRALDVDRFIEAHAGTIPPGVRRPEGGLVRVECTNCRHEHVLSRLAFLRRVSGGCIFLQRLLLEHFADRAMVPSPDLHRSTARAGPLLMPCETIVTWRA